MTCRGAAAIASLVALAIPGCDLPVGEVHDGPRVLRVTPEPGGEPIDRLTTFRIELDRRIAPGSVPQGAVEIESGDNYVFVVMEIDVVRPALLVTPIDPLDPDVDYQLVVHSIRDLDGHVSDDTAPLVFHTGLVETRVAPPTVSYADVAPTLEACATCHGGATPVSGLDLSSAEGVRLTALGVAAREVAPSVVGSVGAEVTAAMIGMPQIDPRGPAHSYLLYTMLADDHIAGAPMPPSGELASEAELQRLEDWIQAGAPGI